MITASYADAVLPGDNREPRCEKRSNTDPARLNIDSKAKLFGLRKPCESSLHFYIARNTLTRSTSGLINVYSGDKELHEYSFDVNFGEPNFGLLNGEFTIPNQSNHACQELTVRISELQCKDINNKVIDCPKVRLKTSMAFNDLMINKSVNVCYDS